MIEIWLECQCDNDTDVILFGDFNFPYLKWSKYEHDDKTISIVPIAKTGATTSTQEQGKLLLDMMDANFFSQRVVESTRKGKNTLDLIYTNSDIISEPVVHSNAISDHDTLHWSITVDQRNVNHSHSPRTCEVNESINDYRIMSKDTDWDTICSELASSLANIDPLFNVSQQLDYFHQCCIKAVAMGAPKRGKRKAFKGIPPHCKALMKKRIKLRKLLENASNCRKKKKVRIDLLDIERKIMYSIDSENEKREKEAISKVKSNPKHFFKFAKKKGNGCNEIRFLQTDDGSITNDSFEMANILNRQYYSVFNKSHVTPHIVQDSHVSNTDNSDAIRLSQFSGMIMGDNFCRGNFNTSMEFRSNLANISPKSTVYSFILAQLPWKRGNPRKMIMTGSLTITMHLSPM